MTVARPNFRAGDLRHFVTVQRPGGSRDSVGERITTWTDVANVYASIDPLSGAEKFAAAQRQASTSHAIELYYDSALAMMDASWRVVSWQEFSADATSDAISVIGPRTYAVGDPIVFGNVGGALPSPLVAGTTYFVKTAPGAGVYTLSTTAGGSTIDLTTAGSGRNLVRVRIFVLDAPPENPGEANVFFRLSCSESVREE